ncbi:MAG TPA: glycosyltransferase [Candidatus Eisenbacteria bacterium]|nr:glycosyltransferase [Candidatus Eisenbacteria bacterium]
MTSSSPDVSVVLPCYCATGEALRSVEILRSFLPTAFAKWEIIVVDDGGNDFGANPLPTHPDIQLLSNPRNAGKGAAVRRGMLAARGKVRVYTDADLPYDRELIPLMSEHIARSGFHIVIGDRTLPASVYAEATSASRRLLSGVASRFIGSLVTGGFFDTQCGIKAMRGDVADALFPLVHIDRFAFDVEVVYVALKHRLDIKRVPVRLTHTEGSTVRPLRDAVRSGVDLLGIKWRQIRGGYRSPELDAIVRSDHEAFLLRHGIRL